MSLKTRLTKLMVRNQRRIFLSRDGGQLYRSHDNGEVLDAAAVAAQRTPNDVVIKVVRA